MIHISNELLLFGQVLSTKLLRNERLQPRNASIRNRELTLEVVKNLHFFGMEGLRGGNVSVYQYLKFGIYYFYLYFIIVLNNFFRPGLSDKISEDAQAKNMRRNSGQERITGNVVTGRLNNEQDMVDIGDTYQANLHEQESIISLVTHWVHNFDVASIKNNLYLGYLIQENIAKKIFKEQCDYELMHLYLYVMGYPKAERLEIASCIMNLVQDILIPLNRDLNTGRDCQSPPPPNVTQAFF
ncbi:uncharacterized protein OCT59_006810 [Rhizophagus irregularis]|uniref:uncharacterized protein n=1 Tax=Rhizophagus irregularis TaxID=588596 RepID=UPI00332974F7|nr:hypothetical protein OCT59_006810 [Rhizophagus irregularis]